MSSVPGYPDDKFPTGIFGLRYKTAITSSNISSDVLDIYYSGVLNDSGTYNFIDDRGSAQYIDEVLSNGDHKILKNSAMIKKASVKFPKIQLGDDENRFRNHTLGVRVYGISTNQDGLITSFISSAMNYKYYFQILANNPSDVNPLVDGLPSNVVFDSRNYGISIHKDIVDSGVLRRLMKSSRDPTFATSLGLCPFFKFKNIIGDYRLMNVYGTTNGNQSYDE